VSAANRALWGRDAQPIRGAGFTLATATAASSTRGPLSAPLDPRICMAKLEQLCARQPVVSTSFLALSRSPTNGPYLFESVQLYELSANSVRSLWRGRGAGADTAAMAPETITPDQRRYSY